MRMIRTLVLATTAGLVATGAAAQEAEPPAIMSVYYRCDQTRQARADTIFQQAMVPLLNKQVQAGNLTGYGLFAHRAGGAYRRLESWNGASVEKVLTAQQAVMEELNQTNAKLAAEFTSICGSHDDYIWNRAGGPIGTPNPSGATATPGFLYSRYFFCEDEGTADMAMQTVYADMLNKHLAAGHIASWGWLTHYFGGTVRRVLNWTAPDLMSVLRAEEMISADLANNYMWGPFSRGCNSHYDYVWTTVANR